MSYLLGRSSGVLYMDAGYDIGAPVLGAGDVGVAAFGGAGRLFCGDHGQTTILLTGMGGFDEDGDVRPSDFGLDAQIATHADIPMIVMFISEQQAGIACHPKYRLLVGVV